MGHSFITPVPKEFISACQEKKHKKTTCGKWDKPLQSQAHKVMAIDSLYNLG
jgi:hypothetical protein